MYKVLAVLLLVVGLILAGLWQWERHTAQAELLEATTAAEERVAAAEKTLAEARLEALGREAESVARSFAAGLYPDLVTDRLQDLDVAVAQLIQLDRVLFVHLLGVEGQVLATSDRKAAETGEAGSRALWALEVAGVTRQSGATADSAEVAVPIDSGGVKIATLLMGYDLREDT